MNSLKSHIIALVAMLSFIVFPSLTKAAWIVPSQDFGFVTGNQFLNLGSDANGHAIVLLPDPVARPSASYFSNGNWQVPVPLDSAGGSISSSALAMENSGTALAVWSNFVFDQVLNKYFDGTNWVSTNPFQLDTAAFGVSVAMNGPDHGLAVWINAVTKDVNYSFFSAATLTWSNPLPIATAVGNTNGFVSVAFSENGTAVAGWSSITGSVIVSNFNGNSWSTPITLDPNATFNKVGIDANGNAIALWNHSGTDVVVSNFNGTSWQPPITLASGLTSSINRDLAVAPQGTAIVIWSNSTVGYSSSYNGLTWELPQQFATDVQSAIFGSLISVSTNGSSSLVIWASTAQSILSSRLPLGGVWGIQEIVEPSPASGIANVTSSLSLNGTGFAGWTTDGFRYFANATIVPTPPSLGTIRVVTENSPTKTDKINVICWTPSSDLTVVSYYLRRNGTLIAVIPARGPYRYCDHNRCNRCDVYTVTAVDADGVESSPLIITRQ